jgi:hypothetical protein
MRRAALTRAGFLEILRIRHGASLSLSDIPKGVSGEKKLFAWAISVLGQIACANSQCDALITARNQCHRDHIIGLRQVPEDIRKDYDQPWNQRYLCHACHRSKTFKRGLGRVWGSDASRNAKIRRAEKRKEDRPCQTQTRPARPWPKPSRPLRSGGRKIPSRPFPKKPPPAGKTKP